MAERGVVVDHATIHRWSIKMLPALAAVFGRRKRPVGSSWRMDETYIKVRSEWKYLYRSVDRTGHTIDFLLRTHRDLAAARSFFERAIDRHGVPEKITIDKSGANTAAIVGICADSGVDIEMGVVAVAGGGVHPIAYAVLTSALLDRLLHHAETVLIEGKSYRSKDQVEV